MEVRCGVADEVVVEAGVAVDWEVDWDGGCALGGSLHE